MSAFKISIEQSLALLRGVTQQSKLVFVFNGFYWAAAVVATQSKEVKIEASATSQLADNRAAIGELIKQLSTQVKRLPKQAVLFTSGVVTGLLDLPVDAKKPRPPAQMQELIRWELENFVADYNELWSLGALLTGRGYISSEQRHEIAVELEIRRSASENRGLTRYGEIAIELGLANREQIDECLLLQEKTVSHDESLICGWQLQPVVDSDGNESHAWLCCAISEQKRQQWLTLFQKEAIQLQWIHPLSLVSLPIITAQPDPINETLVLEQHPEQLIAYRLVNGRVANFQVEKNDKGDLCIDRCCALLSELLRPEISTLYLHVYSADNAVLQAQLATRLGREVILVKGNLKLESSLSQYQASTLEGAAYTLLAGKSSESALRIRSQAPPPPLYKNINFWRYAMPVLLVFSIISMESYGRWKLAHDRAELKIINKKFSDSKKLNSQLSIMNSDFTSAQKKLDEQRLLLADLNNESALLSDVLLARTQFVPQLLRIVAQSIDDEVTIDQLYEPQRSTIPGIRVLGWAASNISASAFVVRLNKNLAQLQFQVSGVEVRAGVGRYQEMQGYALDFWLVPLAIDELDGDFFDEDKGSKGNSKRRAR